MQQDKLFGPCEICEKDRELSLTPSVSGDYQACLCWECLGEVEGSEARPRPLCGPGMAPILPVIADECQKGWLSPRGGK